MEFQLSLMLPLFFLPHLAWACTILIKGMQFRESQDSSASYTQARTHVTWFQLSMSDTWFSICKGEQIKNSAHQKLRHIVLRDTAHPAVSPTGQQNTLSAWAPGVWAHFCSSAPRLNWSEKKDWNKRRVETKNTKTKIVFSYRKTQPC